MQGHAASRSLIQRLSLSIWGLFLVLLLLLSALGYAAMQWGANQIVPLVARRIVQLHARANEGQFVWAQDSAYRLHQELLRRLAMVDEALALARFDALFARNADGLWRLRPEKVDAINAPTLYLHEPPGGMDTSTRLRAVVSYELLREQGPALVPPFFSVYMDFVEDGLMVYARGIDWGSGADAQATNTEYPTMRGANPERNPERKMFWTPVYFDQQAHTWMVSVIKPLDWQGRWAGTLGHDVSVQTLIDTVGASSDEDGMQILMGAGGDLIAHPQLRERIAAADGQLQIASLKDPLLDQVYRMVQAGQGGSGAGRTPDGRQWVAWSRIQGPEWYQVYLLPQERVNRLLMQGLAALFAIGLVGLVPGLWLLRRRIGTLVAQPLLRLTRAVDELGQGRQPQPIALQGNDELSRLATAFDVMVAELAEQRVAQVAHAQALQAEVDERRLFMARLEEERARLVALLGAMDLGIMFASAQGQVVYANAAVLALWRVSSDVVLAGRPIDSLFEGARRQMVQARVLDRHLERLAQNPQVASHCEVTLKDGRILTLFTYPVSDEQGLPLGWLWVHEDVTHERQTAEQLIRLAERDALTGLYNRRRFEEELARFFRQAERAAVPAALLFFDLDEFKYVNDTFGHRAGDEVLVRVAAELRPLIRSTDTFCRLGGDEFAVFMPHAGMEDAQQLAERILHRIAQTPLHLQGQTVRLTTSLGIAHYPTHASDAEDLVVHADTAMYQAKHKGKNRWSVYRTDRDVSQEMVTRLAWNDRISRALEKQLLRLHFQGIYRASDGALMHLEALIRMEDETRPGELIAPAQFIGHAEKTGKILEIDRWVIRESIRMLAQYPHLPGMAVNISGRSFDDPELPAFIAEHLHHHGVAPQRLLVELTETSAVSDLRDAARFIDALRTTGCPICLDDFGTGFASFAYLKHLKADVLKIDGLFIRDLPQEQDNQVFVRAIIEVARGMGKHTVAEFVENEAILQMLRNLGVDMVQGYHLDRPRADHPALRAPDAPG